MVFLVENDVKKVRNDIAKDYFIRYAILLIVLFKLSLDAWVQNSLTSWIFAIAFLYYIYLIYCENFSSSLR